MYDRFVGKKLATLSLAIIIVIIVIIIPQEIDLELIRAKVNIFANHLFHCNSSRLFAFCKEYRVSFVFSNYSSTWGNLYY